MKLFKKVKPYLGIITLIVIPFIFFYPFFVQGKLPIPSDTIVGLYHPYRDLYSKDYPNGIPYKNFLITDPVRQQYPWREFAITSLRSGHLPVWNPYEMSGKPQLANFQTGVFYPLNLLLLASPFYLSWSFFIFLQTFLAGIFMYAYLRSLKINASASILGSLCFSFCGFMVAWLEWGVIGHTYVWLPLILLSLDKITQTLKRKRFFIWNTVFLFSLVASFFAGHLQTFFYVFIIGFAYAAAKILRGKQKVRKTVQILLICLLFLILTSIQWYPTIQFIFLSNRAIDQVWMNPGWFIPWQNLAMFIAPDYFGNPSTLNYYGVWNYAEFIGYIGIPGIILALYAVIFRRDKKTAFFIGTLLFSILFAIPNIISQIPYELKIPFLSSAQPTRLIGIASFSLAVLAALGLDYFMRNRSGIWVSNCIVGAVLVILFIITKQTSLFPDPAASFVAESNLRLPFLLFILSTVVLFFMYKLKNQKAFKMLVVALLLISIFDLLRFGWKFTPFTQRAYLFPETQITQFLEENIQNERIAVLDDRILPPNFQTIYKIPSITGYDPLYLTNYAKLIASNERQDHGIRPPFGYNRIITPKNYNSQIFDLLAVKYILSLELLESSKLKLVLEEGQTKIYENTEVFPYAFFVENVITTRSSDELAKSMFENDLSEAAYTVSQGLQSSYEVGTVEVLENSEKMLILKTNNSGEGFLVISQIYYPGTFIEIDGSQALFYEVDIALTGIEVPNGSHTIKIKRNLF